MRRDQVNALVQRQAAAWAQGNIDAILADFDEAGVFISPGGEWIGHAAIRQAAMNFWAGVQTVHVQVKRVLVDGDHGAVEWRWTEVRHDDEQVHTADDAILFTLKQDKIVYWREYFDTANF